MKRTAAILTISLCALAFGAMLTPGRACAEESLHERAMRLHKSAIIVDTHEDVPEELEQRWVDISARNPKGHVDIPRWREGGVTAPFLAAYVNAEFAKKSRRVVEEGARVHRPDPPARRRESRRTSSSPTRSTASAPAKRDGKIAILIGIEGGHAIENSLGALSAFQRLGVRYMTLTHTNTNDWADSSGNFFDSKFDPKTYAVHGGLTDFGREVVREMNRLGMLVDVSHVSEKTMADAIAASKAPVFASHSSCRALSDIPRNVTDDQIRAIAKSGGVVMVNVSSLFLSQKSVDALPRLAQGGRAGDPGGGGALQGRRREARRGAEEGPGEDPLSRRGLVARRGPHRARDEDRRAAGRRVSARTSTGSTIRRPASRTSRSCPG